MSGIIGRILGSKVDGVRIVPLMVKIILIFAIFLLISNFFSNYINLILNRGEQHRLLNQLLVKDLTDLHIFGQNQHDIFNFTGDKDSALSNIEGAAERRFQLSNSLAMGIRKDGSFQFGTGVPEGAATFNDQTALTRMLDRMSEGRDEGTVEFSLGDKEYLGVYKWHPRWDSFFVRAEETNEFYAGSRRIFWEVAMVIILITTICAVVGIFILRYILRFLPTITNSIMEMQKNQGIKMIDLEGAVNDEVTYLGIAFNSLASTIDNLMQIFKKFVAREVAQRAYREREIRLEGNKWDLTILFTDIRSFTFMTETLGTDIIKLLNIHYNQAIRAIHEQHGDIASIIGDALLAVFGTVDTRKTKGGIENKSYMAVLAAYKIHEMAKSLREKMNQRREEMQRKRGALTEAEEEIYKAVLLQLGVGIDGGEVFYGNIGSQERMVNTVIGDNVNSAARLEGLTRFYNVPVIVSEYVKREIEDEYDDYIFIELDTVQVKGKTVGKQIYWPVEKDGIDADFERDITLFSKGLQLYYKGAWEKACPLFMDCGLPLAAVFIERTKENIPPKDWNGIWTMTEK